MYRRVRGFILKDFLVGLVVIMLVFPIIVEVVRIVSDFNYFDERLQDEIALLHMRQRMIIADDISISSNSLSFSNAKNDWSLKYDGNRLYLSPGYQLILDDVEELEFYLEGNLVYVEYKKDNRYYKKALSII